MTFTPYSGNSAYCFSNSLRMCLQQAGMSNVPTVNLLECMTGMPFGAHFIKLEEPLFFPDTPGIDPEKMIDHALEIIGWTCTVSRFDDIGPARAAFLATIETGPVLLGPLDMGYLPYDPHHEHKHGSDHYIVALRMESETEDEMECDWVRVHDPQLHPFAVLPLADLMQAWDASTLSYATCKYAMRHGFHQHRLVSESDMLADTLTEVQRLVRALPAGPVVYGGAPAFRLAAQEMCTHPTEAFIGMLKYFVLPLGARRCSDGAVFLEQVGKTEAARLMVNKAELFGVAQYYAARNDWASVAARFEQLADVEAQMPGLL